MTLPWSTAQALEFAARQSATPSQSWLDDCGMFNAMARGYGGSGWNTAADQGRALALHTDHTTAPVGAVHFWSGGAGHVALDAGGGQIWSNDILNAGQINKVPFDDIANLWGKPYMGWADGSSPVTWSASWGTNPYWNGSMPTPAPTPNPVPVIVSAFDGVTASSIPASATYVFYYANGTYANRSAIAARFPHATLIPIAVSKSLAAVKGMVLDVENGDATPADAVAWCLAYPGSNKDLVVYCNASTWPSVRSAFQSAKVTEANYWIAEYDNVAAIPAGAIGKQYKNTPGYDESVINASAWPGISAPTPTPPPPVAGFTLDQVSMTITKSVSVVLNVKAPVAGTASAVGVAVRDSAGGHHDFKASLASPHFAAGQSVTLITEQMPLSAGTYSVFGVWRDSAGAWHQFPTQTLVVG